MSHFFIPIIGYLKFLGTERETKLPTLGPGTWSKGNVIGVGIHQFQSKGFAMVPWRMDLGLVNARQSLLLDVTKVSNQQKTAYRSRRKGVKKIQYSTIQYIYSK